MDFFNTYGNSFSKYIFDNKAQFIKFYSPIYFYSNSCYVERQIMKLLYRGNRILDSEDVINILAWKTGKINQSESSSTQSLVYNTDFDYNNPRKLFKTRMGFANAIPLIDSVTDIQKEYSSVEKNNYIDVLQYLIEHSQKAEGIGPVYILTILFFLSHGKLPIYDRFADVALYAINNDINPTNQNRKLIYYPDIPDKSDSNIMEKLIGQNGIYSIYIKRLEAIFYR